MWLFLSKLLPPFVYPIGLAIALIALALALTFTRFRRSARAILLVSILVLWVASMPIFANWFYSRLEARFPAVPVETLPVADVAIVLGGAVGQPLPPRVVPDIGEPGDRVLQAARIFRAGKAGKILVSGGNLPWQSAVAPEAALIGDLLVEFGVPRDAVVLERESRNTYENALNSAAIMRDHGWRTALLVTSGVHMPRAVAVFEKVGIEAVPAATDIRVRFPIYDSLLDFLPDAEALERTTAAMKEWIGLIVYRARGWA